ncbi:hypothetical protein [Neorhizobium galegae]|uniref:Two component sensor kinase n=1 Tax=Neorhizobium galegae bv. officinalis TaxID=323656 RepID=A0A0T7GN34_NEOGA|nr:hypothetical protein [Neorhizobium galegae]CDZ48598.1 Two component sensor kinase [Neorhizobium galegae bv. officinalis]
MKKALLIAVLVMAAPMLAEAKTLKFPSDAPIASIKIPDSWNPKETDTGVDATSSDDAVYLSADVAELKSMDKTVTDAIDFLKEVGVTVDPKTLKETPVEEFNGMQMTTLDWDGKDENGPVSVGLALIQTSPTKGLVVTYWGTKGDEEKHQKELVDILLSIKPIVK